MNIIKKLVALSFMFFCLQTHAYEFSLDLQKACVDEKLSQHKGIKGHAMEVSGFKEYCECEADYIIKRASKEQLNQISKKQIVKPSWLPRLKSNALKSCTARDKQITI